MNNKEWSELVEEQDLKAFHQWCGDDHNDISQELQEILWLKACSIKNETIALLNGDLDVALTRVANLEESSKKLAAKNVALVLEKELEAKLIQKQEIELRAAYGKINSLMKQEAIDAANLS
jgi:hypothetical protein